MWIDIFGKYLTNAASQRLRSCVIEHHNCILSEFVHDVGRWVEWQYSSWNIGTVLLCLVCDGYGVVSWWNQVIYWSLFCKVASLVLGQSRDWLGVIEVNRNGVGWIDCCLSKTMHSKARIASIIYGIFRSSQSATVWCEISSAILPVVGQRYLHDQTWPSSGSEVRAWISYCINLNLWYIITDPNPHFYNVSV